MSTLWPLIRAGVLIACVLGPACRSSPADRPEAGTATRESKVAYVGKIWMSTDPSSPLGTLRIFLSDGMLVMDSCFETYRLARWRALDEHHIEWLEDTVRIVAEATQVGPEDLTLRLNLTGEVKVENYRLAQVPFLCPDARAQASLSVKDKTQQALAKAVRDNGY